MYNYNEAIAKTYLDEARQYDIDARMFAENGVIREQRNYEHKAMRARRQYQKYMELAERAA